jgi:hypothetical protein
VTAGSDVVIEITITNTASNDSFVFTSKAGAETAGYIPEVRREDGTVPPMTRYGRKWIKGEWERGDYSDLESGGTLNRLHSGEKVTDGTLLNKLYNLTQPGRYTVQIRRFDFKEKKPVATSNTITVTVTP